MPDELSPSQAAARIGASTRSIQRWIVAGALPARRVGARWRVASDALDAFSRAAAGGGEVRASIPGTGPLAPIRRLFVANRGEIARRIARTCSRLGISVIVPRTDGPDSLDLLDIEAVVAAAGDAGADAIHPGFGFLAENAAFADAVAAAGLGWVGPPPAAIRAMGDKAAARHLAEQLGVAVVPGYDDADQADDVLRAAATRIGPPLLIKPAAGGGGKGMRVARTLDGFEDVLAAARREARAAFGDERLILEHLVEGARHVEIQVLFDGAGHGIHLGERDCSVQRRHQKVLEESPSPAVSERLRQRLGAWALQLAAAVGYVGAGTCEFLLTDRGEAYFLEMNTRLQVEHPVTELVTGRDLVADQLRIAAGLPLDVDQAAVDIARAGGGHAIEVRLYAEDAEDGFLPATGRIERLRWAAGPGIRVDAGIDEGDEVTGRFDPMLAKVIAHGADRREALARLTAALDGTLILGLTTNLRFLRWLVREPVVRDAGVRIDTLERVWPPDDWANRTALPDIAWRAAARALGTGGWRLNAPACVGLVADDGTERSCELGAPGWDDVGIEVAAVVGSGTAYVDVGGRSVAFRVAPPPDVDRAARAAGSHHAGGPMEVVSPMPGSVIAVHLANGAIVETGDPIVTLEAMKMEHVVAAPIAGRLQGITVRRADQVSRGQVLAIVEP